MALPLYGRIAAGTPIEALRDETNHTDVPGAMLGSGEHYALEVDGDSMIEAGILDGDTAVIERCDTAENGAIVVALVDDSEVTLKRLRRKGESIALEPANKRLETRIFGPGRVKVQGQLQGHPPPLLSYLSRAGTRRATHGRSPRDSVTLSTRAPSGPSQMAWLPFRQRSKRSTTVSGAPQRSQAGTALMTGSARRQSSSNARGSRTKAMVLSPRR